MNNFDLPPINDPITRDGEPMSDAMQLWLSNFVDNLIEYLTAFGIFMPNLSTDDRDSIDSPKNGMIIYNTTTGAPQVYQGGVWKTFTTV